MTKRLFGTTKSGKDAYLFELKNEKGLRVLATDFGATLVSVFVKDKDGKERDIICGYDDLRSYEEHSSYFGATIGRNGNRIANSRFSIDGVTYQLDVNDNENNLHSGKNGTAFRLWQVKEVSDTKIVFILEDREEDQGFPGTALMEVTYELTPLNELKISYYAVCDKKTVFNMTNHAYFNLNGHETGAVYDHLLQIKASHYTPVSSGKAIPTGEILSVEGTPFDFRQAKPIGRDINADNEQLRFVNGYDHNFAIDKTGEGIEDIAYAYSPESGIEMSVATDCIGVQLYTGNFITGEVGKGGVTYVKNGAFCLETQFFPNAINEENFTSPITEANVPYRTTSVYTFGVKW